MSPPLRYLSDQHVRALDLPARAVRQAVAAAFQAFHHGTVLARPKSAIDLAPGHAFQALSAVDVVRGRAVLKWVGMVPPTRPDIVCVNASMQLSDVETGRLLCVMDAQHATALRTAAMSAQAACLLARPDSRSIGFIGTGVQALAHLEALVDALPGLRVLRACSRTDASRAPLLRRAAELRLQAMAASPYDVVAHSDVVVTGVPGHAGLEAFLDPRWLRPGAFVASIDLGRPWLHGPLPDVDILAVDDEPMKYYAKPGNLVPPLQHAHATLAELCAGHAPGRTRADQRAMFFSSGSAIADLAIAVEIHDRAVASGVGTTLSP